MTHAHTEGLIPRDTPARYAVRRTEAGALIAGAVEVCTDDALIITWDDGDGSASIIDPARTWETPRRLIVLDTRGLGLAVRLHSGGPTWRGTILGYDRFTGRPAVRWASGTCTFEEPHTLVLVDAS